MTSVEEGTVARTDLIRTVSFNARHHYRIPEWSDERNREAFGETAEPHEHGYRLEVTVTGEPAPRTGFVVDLPALDRALEEVVGPLRDRSLNEAVPAFRDGAVLPSTENLAAWFFRELQDRLPEGAELVRVRIYENDDLAAAYEP